MGHRDDLIAAMAVFLVVDTLAIAARLYVRTKMLTRGFGLDDVVLILTYVTLPTILILDVYGLRTNTTMISRSALLSPVLWALRLCIMAMLLETSRRTTARPNTRR